MKIQCDVCEKAPATVICCADEAALCGKCDVEVHAANKLASKHQRLLLQSLSNKLPCCDICQEKTAFIFCVEDRALFCKDCDEPIHAAGTIAANHQRFLATGILVGLASTCSKDSQITTSLDRPPPPPPPNHNHNKLQKQKQNQQQQQEQQQQQQVPSFESSWPVDDDLLRFSDFESSEKKEQLEFGEFEWITEMGLFDPEQQEALAAAEVPQLPMSHYSSPTTFYRPPKANMPYKKLRLEISDDDEEFFTVPDLG